MSLSSLLRKTAFAAGLTASVTLNSGCAFGNREVDLKYDACVTSVDGERGKFSLGNFQSELETDKKGRQIIGCVRNGYGWKTAKVLAKGKSEKWLRDAIEKELECNGYIRVETDAPIIEGTLNRFYTDLYINYDSDVSFSLRINDNSGTIFADSFYGNASPLAWFVTPSEYEKASREALQSALRKAIPKISLEIDKANRK